MNARKASRPATRPPNRGAAMRGYVPGLTLTTRAALLGLALCGVVLTLVYPAREYLAQHRQVSQLAQQVAADKAQVKSLEAAGLRDTDPTYIEQQARERLHMQFPNDKTYIVTPLPPPKLGKQTAGAVHTPVLAGRGKKPWYSQLYKNTVESGR